MKVTVPMVRWLYSPLRNDIKEDRTDSPTDNFATSSYRDEGKWWQTSLGWKISTLMFASLSLFLLTKINSFPSSIPYIGGYLTEFVPAQHTISFDRVKFTGTAAFFDNGTAYRIIDTEQPQYVGIPSPSVDNAWDELIEGRYFNITKDEARQAWGDMHQQYFHYSEDRYLAGIDVFHTLHCLNVVRKAIYPEYYKPDDRGSIEFERYHIDHCIDLIRQSLMCHGDLTLIPTRWFRGINGEFIDSDQWHTCRSFPRIREWVTERFNGSLSLRHNSEDVEVEA